MKKRLQSFKKALLVMLVSMLTFTSTFMSSTTEVSAASTWGEYVGTVKLAEKLENIAIPGLREGGNIYRITMNGEAGFCLNHYAITDTGYRYTRQDSKLSSVNSKVMQAANYYAKDPDNDRYMLTQCIIWGIIHGAINSFDVDNKTTQDYIDNAMGYIQGRTNWNAYKKRILLMNDMMFENNNWNAMQFIMHSISNTTASTAGWHYYYRNNASQPILTKFDGVWVEPRLGVLNSTKSSDEKVDVEFIKVDNETNMPLEGVEVSFYRDDEPLKEHVFTDSKGKASATFLKSHSATSDNFEYCLNWGDLSDAQRSSLSDQGVHKNRDSAQSAADKQAKQRADAIVASQKHTYKVVELNTITDYYLDPNNTTVIKTMTGAGTLNLSLGNQHQTGSISIVKYDGETNEKVLGASYKLYAAEPIFHPDGKTGLIYDKDTIVETFPSTDESGYSNLGNLYLGKYYIKEDVAPYGYTLSNERYDLELTYAGQDVKVVFGNQDVSDVIQRGQIIISKVDEELYNKSKDASITDFDENGTQGDASLEGATYGLYVQSDIIHPDGKTGVISYNNIDDDIYEIELTKGSDLVVYDTKASANTLIATAKTDENGQIEFSHLLLGDYYVKELEPSEGYLLNDTKYDISLAYADQKEAVSVSKKTVFETVKRQAFELYKGGHTANTSANATPLEGVHFEVKLESDIQRLIDDGKTLDEAKKLAPLYDELITDKEGKATSIELPYGTYRVIETVPSEDYMAAEDFFITISEDSRNPQDFSNNVVIDEVFTSYLKLVKQDIETGKTVLLKDTTFKVRTLEDTNFNGKSFKAGEYLSYFTWDSSDGFTVDTWKTDETGTVLLGEKLMASDYELVEIKSPYGYVLNEEPVKFTITNGTTYEVAPDGNPIITAVMKDLSTKGKVAVYKVGDVVTNIVTDSLGNINFEYDCLGIDGAKFEVEAAEDIYSADKHNDLVFKKGQIVDTIEIYSGYGESKELPLGKYNIHETVAGDGYILNKEVKSVELTYQDQYTAVVFGTVEYENERQKVEVTVTKKDADDKSLLAGATFGLYAKDDIYSFSNLMPVFIEEEKPLVSEGDLIETVTTDETGSATFKVDLPLFHEFEIREIEAPKGYASSDYVYEFYTEYKGQDKAVVNYDAVFENEITKIEVSKKDITNGEEIAGAFLVVYSKEDNTILDTWTSGDDGLNEDGTIKPHLIKGLEVGKTYYLEEIIAPHGYAIANEIAFTVLDTGEIQKVEMMDEIVMGQLKWKKTGEIFNDSIAGTSDFGETLSPIWNEANLIGAEITIYAAEDITIGNHTYYKTDEAIETLVSSEEDVLSKELYVGRYYYVETKVAEGYVIDTTKHYFEIKNSAVNELQTIESSLLNTRATFEIDTAEELVGLNKLIVDGTAGSEAFSGKTVKLTADIDLGWYEWYPINFYGTFDGGNHTIKNITYIPRTDGRMGFFQLLAGPAKNLTLDGIKGTVPADGRFGGVARYLNGVIENVHVKNVTVTTTDTLAWVGGITAYTAGGRTVDCSVENITVNAQAGADLIGGAIALTSNRQLYSNTDVKGFKVIINDTHSSGCGVGGLVGQTQTGWNNPKFDKCDVTGIDITASGLVDVGGFIAWPGAHTEYATNCTTEGKIDSTGVTSSGCFAGGFFGNLGWNCDLGQMGHFVTDCSADVDITTKIAAAGGFVGSATNSNNNSMYATFTNCTATGDITLVEGGTAPVGGFAGNADRGVYTNCVATGNVTGLEGTTGGFIGQILDTNPKYDSRYPAGTRPYLADYITFDGSNADVEPFIGTIANTKPAGEIKKTDTVKPTAEITYSNEGNPTNKDVVVTLTAREEIEKPGSEWTAADETGRVWTATYHDNGKVEDFTIVDKAGNESEKMTIEVKGIDKVAPTFEVKNKLTEDNKVIVTLTASEKVTLSKEGWTATEVENQFVKVYSENGEDSVVITDAAGNSAEVKVKVTEVKVPTPTPEKPKAPETGDTTNVFGLLAMLLGSAFIISRKRTC